MNEKWKWKSLSHVWLFVTLWTIQSMEFSRPWSGSFSRGSSRPRNRTQVSWIESRFFINWAIRKAPFPWIVGSYFFSKESRTCKPHLNIQTVVQKVLFFFFFKSIKVDFIIYLYFFIWLHQVLVAAFGIFPWAGSVVAKRRLSCIWELSSSTRGGNPCHRGQILNTG